MTSPAMLALAGLLLAAAPAGAEDHRQMRAAEHDLQSARSHLQAAVHEFEGHRRAAIEHIDKALAEVHQGVAAAESKETGRTRRRPRVR
jgi:hypothetical protein